MTDLKRLDKCRTVTNLHIQSVRSPFDDPNLASAATRVPGIELARHILETATAGPDTVLKNGQLVPIK